ncbi:MAG: tol-pal system-associated acyl-CoA thioesterase [Gammaproteobacteria bacterium]|nr:tol-pal system-associated acyl-CoA thioesterase [Gammaproteobacteria bacterium]
MSETFLWPVRVYYEDTDAGGVVYYANYLRFMERARTEWLRRIGVEQDALRVEQGVIFVVVAVDIQYQSPARFNDALEVSVSVTELKHASLTFAQRVFRGDESLCQANVRVGCVNAETLRPSRLPRGLKEAAA